MINNTIRLISELPLYKASIQLIDVFVASGIIIYAYL
ncbi:hypothetical protein J2787_000973 [Chryseobacterium rhizosphaerae]|uniref:Uncharacterized protein n=1 Tax=Chryseobacterium rhizosphaerae TaxID=395937 RepID=A0AAE4C1L5_9FLAO|nr:hypothetical protein [Chryseobacterium rhizosphaerae]